MYDEKNVTQIENLSEETLKELSNGKGDEENE